MKSNTRLSYAELVECWRRARIGKLVNIGRSAGYPLFCWKHSSGSRQLLLSAGIHGDEPAGPMAVTRLLKERPGWFTRHSWTVFPCLNPWGYDRDCRQDRSGTDLNRRWRRLDAPEIRAVRRVIEGCRFEMAILMHEDYDADGFYLYELVRCGRPHGSRILDSVGRILPVDSRPAIEGRRVSRRGMILRNASFRPGRRKFWPEAFYLVERHTGHLFTTETPSTGFALERRTRAQLQALRTALEALRNEGLRVVNEQNV